MGFARSGESKSTSARRPKADRVAQAQREIPPGSVERATWKAEVEADAFSREELLKQRSRGQYRSEDAAIEDVFERGQVKPHTADERFREAMHNLKWGVKSLFVTTPGLKGSDPVGTHGAGVSRTRFFSTAMEYLRRTKGAHRDAQQQAGSWLSNVKRFLRDEHDVDLLGRAATLLNDAESMRRGEAITLGLTPENVVAELKRLKGELNARPHVAQALRLHLEMVNAWAEELQRMGKIPLAEYAEKATRQYYFPKLLLDYDPAKGYVPSRRGLREFASRFTRKRQGSLRDYNRDYFDAMSKYLTDMFEMRARNEAVNATVRDYDFRNKPVDADAAKAAEEWKAAEAAGERVPVPDGHVWYNTKTGFQTGRATNVFEREFEGMMDDGAFREFAERFGISPAELKQFGSKIMGQHAPPGETYIIPKELADEIQNLMKTDESILPVVRDIGRAWKTVALHVNPIRYNFRNAIGDFQRSLAQFGPEMANAERWRKTAHDVLDFYATGRASDRVRGAIDNVVMSAGRITEEVADVHTLRRMAERFSEARTSQDIAKTLKSFIELLPVASSAREDLMRLYVYNMNVDRMLSGQEPLRGIVPQEYIQGIMETVPDYVPMVAGTISRKALGDYGDATRFLEYARNTIAPFAMWARINVPFWVWELPKAVAQGAVDPKSASSTAVLSGTAMVAAAAVIMRTWNRQFDPNGDLEDALREDIPERGYLFVPDMEAMQRGEFKPQYYKDEAGIERVATISLPDALDDAMMWTGTAGLPASIRRLQQGKVSQEEFIKERVEEAWKAPIRGVGNLLGPLVTIPSTLAFGRSLFPDPTRPREVTPDERWTEVMNQLLVPSIPGVAPAVEAASSETALQRPPTILDPAKSLGYRETPLNRFPSYIQDDLYRTLRRAKELKELMRDIGKVQAGQGRRSMTFEERQRWVERKRKTAMRWRDEVQQSVARFHDLIERYQLGEEARQEFMDMLRAEEYENAVDLEGAGQPY